MKITASSEEALNDHFIAELHTRLKPHAGQIPLGRALFVDGVRKIGANCGRKFGKSTIGTYCGIRWAGTHRDHPVYFIAPEYTQARQIYWYPRTIEKLINPKFIKKVHQQSTRIELWNGSFIVLAGTDNDQSLRGPNPGLAIIDEYKDAHPEFWRAFKPNLLSLRAPFIVLGTPPDNDITPAQINYFSLMEECRTDGCLLEFSSFDNPHIDKGDLQSEINRLIANGEEDVAQREYYAKFVKGGSSAVFPMFNRDSQNIFSHSDLLHEIRDKHLEWYCTFDPGTASCFAVLFLAYDPESKIIYVFDELYETNQDGNSVMTMFQKEEQIIRTLYPYPDEWNYIYDEAATWFANERTSLDEGKAYPRFNLGLCPTQKLKWKAQTNELKPGLSMAKDIMRVGLLKVSDKCKNFIWEVKSYIKDKNGNIPKSHDHLLDALRYTLFRIGYSLNYIPREVVKPTKPAQDGRAHISGAEEANSSLDTYRPESDSVLSLPVDDDYFY